MRWLVTYHHEVRSVSLQAGWRLSVLMDYEKGPVSCLTKIAGGLLL